MVHGARDGAQFGRARFVHGLEAPLGQRLCLCHHVEQWPGDEAQQRHAEQAGQQPAEQEPEQQLARAVPQALVGILVVAGQRQGAVLLPAVLDQGLAILDPQRDQADEPLRHIHRLALVVLLDQGLAARRDDPDEAVVTDVELRRHHQLERRWVLFHLAQRQRERGRVVDVLDLQLLLQILPRRIDIDHQADAKGR
jgi:hypothetical protein